MGGHAGDAPRAGAGSSLSPDPDVALDLTRQHGPDADELLARGLLEAVTQPVAVFECGVTITIAAANEPYAEMTGVPVDDLLGAPMSSLVDGETAREAEHEVRAVAATGKRRDYSIVVDLPSGRRRVDTVLIPLGAPGTPASRVLAVTDDLTPVDEAKEALRHSEERFASLASSSALGVFYTDPSGDVLYTNSRLEEILGAPRDAILGSGWWDRVHVDDRAHTADALARTIKGERIPPLQMRVVHDDGTVRWVEVRSAPVQEAGTVTGFVGTVEDHTVTVESRDLARQLGTIIEATTDWVGLADPEGYLRYLNEAARAFHGFGPDDDLEGQHVLDLYTSWSRRKFVGEVIPQLEKTGRWSGELAFRSVATGREVDVSQVIQAHHDRTGAIRWFSSIARDITERKEFERRLAHQALHDPLTGLPNRLLFMDRLSQGLARARRNGTEVAVLFLDVDRFKLINDSLGHDAGDQVLRDLARRLERLLRPSDTVARLGGDEFVLLCEDVAGDGRQIAERVEHALGSPFDVDGNDVFVTVSIGLARSSDPGSTDPEALLRDADAAMYRAKQRGRARFEVFDERMRAQAAARLTTENELRKAIATDELELHYQPVVSLESGTIVGVESLVRWPHPQQGLLQPRSFIPLAEEAGLIVPLGDWVLRAACAQVARWRRDVPAWAPTLWVNLSARQLTHLQLLETVEELVSGFGFEPGTFGLEITESALMEDSDVTEATLCSIAEMGVSLAIDDFGTGYSSLTNLKRFPVDTLKVDRSFVAGLGSDPEDSAIVAAQVGMAHALGIGVIAEGVEDVRQLAELRELGCEHAQGFLFSPPLAADAVTELLDLEPRW